MDNNKYSLDIMKQELNNKYISSEIKYAFKVSILALEKEQKMKDKLNYLYEMQKKYHKLNEKTKNKYNWRENAIDNQIEVLEDILENSETDWNTCYEEDVRESEKL